MNMNSRPNLLASALALAIAATALTPAMAQSASDQSQDTGTQPVTKLQAVEVTGSRIKGADMATQVPVVTITSDDIRKTGLTSVGDILQQLSSSGSALNTKFNSAGNFGFPPDGSGVGSGSSTLDLRNLGAKRVLVLVDGLRWVNESSASGVSAAVDLNTIPAGIIDRIEILQDGASALYGSDAIAGVVNIITKHKQKGGAASVYYGSYNNLSGGSTSNADLSFGGSTDRLDFFTDFNYVRQNGISSGAWNQAGGACVPGTGLSNCSSATPTGRFLFSDPSSQFQNLTLNGPVTGVASYPSDFHNFTTADRFNFAPFNLLLTPNERKSVFAQTRYRLTDNITWYARGLYNRRTSLNQAAPEPIFLGPGAGTGGLADTVGVDVTNPYNPFGYTLSADPANTNPADASLILIGRRPIEGGPRRYSQDVDTTYFATGLKGSFGVGEHDYYWEVNFADGSNKATQTVTGTYNVAHIQRALGPLAGCTGSCVPLNVFGGPGTITPAMLQYIQYIEHDTSENKIRLYTANLSGELFNLPAGPLSFATGAEHRSYHGSYQPDAVVVAGETNGVPSLPTTGRYSINEYYLELNAPLLKDLPGVKSLDLSAASRHSNYSTFGSTTNSKLGLRWQVFDDLTLRSTWAQGFRAPSIGELFGSPARFDATLQDPCSGVTSANCTALGVPAGYTQPNPQISVRTGGNRQLNPETARSLTVGAVYSPGWAANTGWAEKTDITLGYYRIRIANAIQALDAQTKLNRCVTSGDVNSVFCEGIHRNATGNIDGFDNTLQNLGRINTSGFDFGVSWRGPRSDIGQFNAHWQSTYVSKYEARNGVGALEPRAVGMELNDSAIPRINSNLGVGWTQGAWSLDYKLRYVSGLREDCAGAAGFPICNHPNEIAPNRPNGTHYLDAVTYSDLRASWKVPVAMDLTITAGINNLFNKQPPVCVSCSLNGYDASTYDLPSRFTYLQADVRF